MKVTECCNNNCDQGRLCPMRSSASASGVLSTLQALIGRPTKSIEIAETAGPKSIGLDQEFRRLLRAYATEVHYSESLARADKARDELIAMIDEWKGRA